jgi:glycosyltransferase involved in cell wall biosynthesis
MKVLMIIDHFGLGGAQRQMVELACGMKRRGHEVDMFSYFPKYDFFRPLLEEHRITLHEYAKGAGFSFGVLARLIALLRERRFDVVVSYLNSPNIYAELAAPFAGGSKLVVSERVGHQDDKSPVRSFLRRAMHVVADKVVANSRTHCDWLRRKWWLRNKAVYIYNGLNLQVFRPQQGAVESAGGLRLIAIGRVGPQKNILNLIAALGALQSESGDSPQISWVGQRDESELDRPYCRRIDEALESLPEIRRRWHWLGVRADVPELLRRHGALIHPSFYEGLPNVVCEALATGIPVLASAVCDHPLLVAEGERGFLFDPESPQSIAAAITRFTALSVADRRRFSRNAREYAEANLGVEKMVGAYESLFMQLLRGETRSATSG